MGETKCKHGITAWREFCVICGDGQPPAEHSERAKYVTELVAEWVVNDGDYYCDVQESALYSAGSVAALVRDVLRTAATDPRYHGSKPWRVTQELAPNDYARIRWVEVADALLAED